MLADAGMAAEDIELSRLIQHWLAVFDSLVFSERLPVVFYTGSPRDEVAAFHYEEQQYVIVVPGLCRKMKEVWRRQIVHFTQNGIISYPLSRANKEKTVSLLAVIMAVATHEVRHRRNRTPGSALFTYEYPKLSLTTWEIYEKLRKQGSVTAQDILELELSSWRDEEEKMEIDEFDAKVIERTALNQAYIGFSAAQIAETIKMQPHVVAESSMQPRSAAGCS
jgi:hypothetical protein